MCTEGGDALTQTEQELYKIAEKNLYEYARIKHAEPSYYGDQPEVHVKAGYGDPTANLAIGMVEAQSGWVRAIEDAWAELTHINPLKARFMEDVYGLSKQVERKDRAQRRNRIMQRYNIEYTTYYTWRKDVVSLVIYHVAMMK